MLHGIDYFVVIVYMVGIMLLGLYFKKFVHSSEDYFLAGKFQTLARRILSPFPGRRIGTEFP